MNKEKFLKELKRTRSQAESLMYSLHYLLEETVYDARDYVDNELMKPIFDELDNQEQAVMNGEVSDSRRRVKDGSMTDADYSAIFEEIAEEVLEDFSYNVHFKRDVDAYALPASEMKNIIDMCYYPVNLGRVYERIVNGGATTGDKNIDDNVIYLAENLIQDVKDENEGIGDDDVWDVLYEYDYNQVVYIVKAKSVNGGLDIEITVEVGVKGVGNNTVIYNDFIKKNSPDNFMADDSDNERFEGSVRSAIEYARDYIENLEY